LPGSLVTAVRLAIQGDPKDKVKQDKVIVQELEIYPQMDERLKIEQVDSLFTDTEALMAVRANLQASTIFKYRLAGSSDNYSTGGYGRLQEAATAVGLKPDTRYDYYVQLQDFNANILEGDTGQFQTKPKSLAAGAQVTGSFLVGNTQGTQNILVDGDLDKEVSSGSIYDKDQELIIDLGRNKPVGEVIVYWSRLAYSKNYSILGSTDGKKWDILAKDQDASKGFLGRTKGAIGGRPMKVLATKCKQQTLRYVKVLVPKNSDFYHKHTSSNYVDVFEVKVF